MVFHYSNSKKTSPSKFNAEFAEKLSRESLERTITTIVTRFFFPGPTAFFQAKLNLTSSRSPPLLYQALPSLQDQVHHQNHYLRRGTQYLVHLYFGKEV
uniref:Uncharacterized protein n=1 Tax=Arundo donax TaxID=35708 RepID=A0A0A9CL70_ARUDO